MKASGLLDHIESFDPGAVKRKAALAAAIGAYNHEVPPPDSTSDDNSEDIEATVD
jgi:hypothetical protein